MWIETNENKTDCFLQVGVSTMAWVIFNCICTRNCFVCLVNHFHHFLDIHLTWVLLFFLCYSLTFQAEIIATCQENIQCLETVLRGPVTGGHLLSTVRTQQARGKLSNQLALNPLQQRHVNDDANDTRNHRTIIIIHRQCRCSQITMFIARVLDFVLDYTNIFRNFRLYRYFVSVLRRFYNMVGYVSKGLLSVAKCRYLF